MQTSPDFMQLCFVVEDLEAAMANFTATFGAGPWFVSSGFSPGEDPTLYRGQPAPLETDIALGYAGGMMFELACPRPASRSIFREVADENGFGLHHLGFGVNDFETAMAALAERHVEVLTTSVTPRGARIAMFAAGSPTNLLHEYIEILPASRRFYAFMQEAARTWDSRTLCFDGTMPDFSTD